MNLLFVCNQGLYRSRTACDLFQGRDGHTCKCAGTDPTAPTPLTEEMLRWADRVVYMMPEHRNALRDRFPRDAWANKLLCLYLEDVYDYFQKDLVVCLEAAWNRILNGDRTLEPSLNELAGLAQDWRERNL